jgi:hypothetical protein
MGFSNFTKIAVTPNPTDLTSCKVQTHPTHPVDMNAGKNKRIRAWILTWCKIMGLLAKSTRGLGTLNVSGLSRVPNPPTKIKAFMVRVEISSQQPQQSKVGPNGRKGIPEIFAPNSKISPTYQNCHF